MKLSKPQIELLRDLERGAHHVASYYPPFIKLKALGLAAEREGKYSSVAYITDAGREIILSAPSS